MCACGDRVQVDYVVSGNLHTKLHALLSCLDFRVGDDDLTTEEKKKLMLTHHYINDKDAILWRTFTKELGEEGIRPVTPVGVADARNASLLSLSLHTHRHSTQPVATRSTKHMAADHGSRTC